MIQRILARRRLTVCYWPSWFEVTCDGRQKGPRPILALHRTPDPDCPYCRGTGEVPCGSPTWPDIDQCQCTPFAPLLLVPLPKILARITDAIAYRRNRHLYSDEPPF